MIERLENFTPGPWQVGHCEHVTGFCVQDSDGLLVALPCAATLPSKVEPLNNAYLIAAAPEMYAIVSTLENWHIADDAKVEDVEMLLRKAVKVAKKARGEE